MPDDGMGAVKLIFTRKGKRLSDRAGTEIAMPNGHVR